MANTVIYQKRGAEKVKVAETPDLSPYAIKADVEAELATKADAEDLGITDKRVDNIAALMNGALSVQNTDSTSAYAKTVPSKAQPYAAVQEIGGKTLCWNQIFPSQDVSVSSETNITVTRTGSGPFIITCAATATSAGPNLFGISSSAFTAGHKYAFLSSDSRFQGSLKSYGKTTDTIFEAGTASYNNIGIYFTDISAGTYNIYLYLIDLTLMFGSGNEPSTVSEFTAMFPTINPAYNAGTLISAGVTGAVSVGKNLWNATQRTLGTAVDSGVQSFDFNKFYLGMTRNNRCSNTGTYYFNSDGSITYVATTAGYYGFGVPFSCVPGEQYTVSCTWAASSGALSLGFGFYTNDGVYVSNTEAYATTTGKVTKTITIPDNVFAVVIVLGPTAINVDYTFSDIQFEHGSTATAYTPYRAPVTLPIPSAVQQLPGYGWSAGSVYNEVDFERKVYVQKVASVDLGTLGWNSITGSDNFFYTEMLNGSAKPMSSNSLVGNILCAKYVTVSRIALVSQSGVISIGGSPAANVQIRDTEHSPATMTTEQFRTYISGTTLYYELATPIETDISSLLSDDNLIGVEPGGTLTFPNQLGDDYRLPVPSDVEYTIDLAPDTPSTDGTYTLQCTVADGVATYSWVSA